MIILYNFPLNTLVLFKRDDHKDLNNNSVEKCISKRERSMVVMLEFLEVASRVRVLPPL